MKTKIYYLFLLVMFILTSCKRTDNISEPVRIGTLNGMSIIMRIVEGHEYISITDGYSHSGSCKKCKAERDSITNIIIKEIRK